MVHFPVRGSTEALIDQLCSSCHLAWRIPGFVFQERPRLFRRGPLHSCYPRLNPCNYPSGIEQNRTSVLVLDLEYVEILRGLLHFI